MRFKVVVSVTAYPAEEKRNDYEHQLAILTVDLPQEGFKAGDVGTVVHVYGNHSAYEVEFFALNGRTLAVVTVEAAQIRAVDTRDLMHVRQLVT